MDPYSDTDVAIAGAGPAGLACALQLANEGFRITLIDKETFPRNKPCGGGLGVRSLRVLKDLGIDLSGFEFKNAVNGIKIHTPTHRTHIFRTHHGEETNKPLGYVVDRSEFDYFLLKEVLKHPQVTFLSDHKVKMMESNGQKVITAGDGFRVISDWGIDARGARYAEHEGDRKDWAFAMTGIVSGVDFEEQEEHLIEFYFTEPFFPGYFWIFPLPEGRANSGIYVPLMHYKYDLTHFKEAFYEFIQNHQELAGRFLHAGLKDALQGGWLPIGHEIGEVVNGHILRVGDAASLVDPLAGEGIGNALLSGLKAARTIIATKNGNMSLEAYEKELKDLMEAEFRHRHRLLRLAARYPKGFSILFSRLAQSQHLRRLAASAVRSNDFVKNLSISRLLISLLH
ncbi:MAG: NAD(P)/FAD-dependent oxidoreductase [Bacteroidales bacterium]